MRLKYLELKAPDFVRGVEAHVIRNDIAGACLIIQSNDQRIEVKLSDLITAIAEQKSEDDAKAEAEEAKEGSKGDSVEE